MHRGEGAHLFILIPNFFYITMIINSNILRIFQYFPMLFFSFPLFSIIFHYLLSLSIISIIILNFPLYFIIIYCLLRTSIYLYYILSYVSILHQCVS